MAEVTRPCSRYLHLSPSAHPPHNSTLKQSLILPCNYFFLADNFGRITYITILNNYYKVTVHVSPNKSWMNRCDHWGYFPKYWLWVPFTKLNRIFQVFPKIFASDLVESASFLNLFCIDNNNRYQEKVNFFYFPLNYH